MVNLTIDGKQVQVPEGTTILKAAAAAGIEIPTLCFLKDLNEIGACRICCVEIEGKETLAASCNTKVEEGMTVYTSSLKAHYARRMNLQIILSQHDFRCAACQRNGSCSLQKICADMNINDVPFQQDYEKSEWDMSFPLIRNAGKCIKCMRCVQICDKVQSLNIWDIVNTGKRTSVGVSKMRKIAESDCSLCGQCITHCPTGALRERDDVRRVMDAVNDPDKIVVAQIAPAVRASWGEGLGLAQDMATEKRMAAAARALGMDYVFDTNFSADLTIMEEANEFLERMAHREEYQWPMFTSCCPGWVRFLKSQYPDMTKQLSTAKSPQQMFGAVAKSYFAEKVLDEDPEKIFCVSIMPCTAKKAECELLPGGPDAAQSQLLFRIRPDSGFPLFPARCRNNKHSAVQIPHLSGGRFSGTGARFHTPEWIPARPKARFPPALPSQAPAAAVPHPGFRRPEIYNIRTFCCKP